MVLPYTEGKFIKIITQTVKSNSASEQANNQLFDRILVIHLENFPRGHHQDTYRLRNFDRVWRVPETENALNQSDYSILYGAIYSTAN